MQTPGSCSCWWAMLRNNGTFKPHCVLLAYINEICLKGIRGHSRLVWQMTVPETAPLWAPACRSACCRRARVILRRLVVPVYSSFSVSFRGTSTVRGGPLLTASKAAT